MIYHTQLHRPWTVLVGTFLLTTLLFTHTVFSQYKPVDQGSSVEFTVKHFGLKTSGSFSGLKGVINFDTKLLHDAQFDITLDANSINTDNTMRDSHLRGESYFNVSKYPLMHFISSKISQGKDKSFLVTGQLTIKDISRQVSIPFTVAQAGNGYIFKGTFAINRKDFDIGGGGVISDEVGVNITMAVAQENQLH